MDRASEVRWRPNDQPTKEWKVMHIRGGEHNANNNNENREIRPQNIRQRIHIAPSTKKGASEFHNPIHLSLPIRIIDKWIVMNISSPHTKHSSRRKKSYYTLLFLSRKPPACVTRTNRTTSPLFYPTRKNAIWNASHTHLIIKESNKRLFNF